MAADRAQTIADHHFSRRYVRLHFGGLVLLFVKYYIAASITYNTYTSLSRTVFPVRLVRPITADGQDKSFCGPTVEN